MSFPYWKLSIPLTAMILILGVFNNSKSETFGSHVDISVENQTCIDNHVTIVLRNTGTEYVDVKDIVVEKDGFRFDYMWAKNGLNPGENMVFDDTCLSSVCRYDFRVLAGSATVSGIQTFDYC